MQNQEVLDQQLVDGGELVLGHSRVERPCGTEVARDVPR
jgi:hypothetical protein